MTKTGHRKDTASEKKTERIAKVLARAGIASRREVERMIEAGRISLNGDILTTPATLVENTQGILVDGRPVAGPQRTRVWRYHKPRGVMTSHSDPEGRPTVFSTLPKDMPRVISVGRLDYNTEGLLLLTNDGGLSRWMELPETGWKRQYKVRVHGRVNEEALGKLRKGITIEGVKYGSIDARLERTQGANAWLKVSIREGKNREIRKVLSALELEVNRLIRTAYGPFELGSLPAGEVDEMSEDGLMESVPDHLIYQGRSKLGTRTSSSNKKPDKANTGRARAKPKRKTPGNKPRKPKAGTRK